MGSDPAIFKTKKLKEISHSKWINLAVCMRNGFAAHKSKFTNHTENININKDFNINKGNWLKEICLMFNFVAYCESTVKQNIFVFVT